MAEIKIYLSDKDEVVFNLIGPLSEKDIRRFSVKFILPKSPDDIMSPAVTRDWLERTLFDAMQQMNDRLDREVAVIKGEKDGD